RRAAYAGDFAGDRRDITLPVTASASRVSSEPRRVTGRYRDQPLPTFSLCVCRFTSLQAAVSSALPTGLPTTGHVPVTRHGSTLFFGANADQRRTVVPASPGACCAAVGGMGLPSARSFSTRRNPRKAAP